MHNALRRLRKRWFDALIAAAGIGVIAVVFLVVLPRIADYGDVWRSVRSVSWPWLAVMLGAAAINVVTFAPPLMAALPGMRFRPALAVTLASTASTYVAPGGPALGMTLSFAMLRGWGFNARAVTVAVTVTAVWNQFVTFGMPAVSLGLLTLSGGRQPLLQTAALIGFVVFLASVGGFAIVLSSARQARTVGDLAARATSALLRLGRRDGVTWSGATFVRFRADTFDLLRRRWHVLTMATLLGHLTVYLVLIVTLRALGVSGDEVSLAESFAAWTVARIIAAIPITPGGFGAVELGLTSALVLFGGPTSEVVAAVLVYRFLTVGPPLILGVIAGATWRRHNPGGLDIASEQRQSYQADSNPSDTQS